MAAAEQSGSGFGCGTRLSARVSRTGGVAVGLSGSGAAKEPGDIAMGGGIMKSNSNARAGWKQ